MFNTFSRGNDKKMEEEITNPLERYLFNTRQTAHAFHIKNGIPLSALYRLLNGKKSHRGTVRRICAATKGELKMSDFGL